MVKPLKKKRVLTPKQKEELTLRLEKARAAKGPAKNVSVHESIRDLTDDHPLSPKKVRKWIKDQQLKLRAMKALKNSNDRKEKAAYHVEEGYLHNMQAYIRTGIWLDNRAGADREQKVKLRCTHLAYDKNGNVKRTLGVYYPDLGGEWTLEMELGNNAGRKISNKGKVHKARRKNRKRA